MAPSRTPGQLTLVTLPVIVILEAGITDAMAEATQLIGELESVTCNVYGPAARPVATDVVMAEGVQEKE
jgi:hypothetical protein